jgi:uncharacterized protein YigA (DUF484 family)
MFNEVQMAIKKQKNNSIARKRDEMTKKKKQNIKDILELHK